MLDNLTLKNGVVNVHVLDSFIPKVNEILKDHELYKQVEGMEIKYVEEAEGNIPKFLYFTPEDFTQKQLAVADILVDEVSKQFIEWYKENHNS